MKKLNTFWFLLILSCFFSTKAFTQEKKETSLKSDPSVPIFEIKNDLNQTVFAVYPGGVKIFIDDQLKAAGGGFTVGRLGTGKATGDDFFTVNPGDVRVILPTVTGKAAGGGFTVGRLGTGKASGDPVDFFSVTPDSTRVNLSETAKGGFAIGKVGKSSGIDNFMNITPDNYFIGHNVAPNITTGLRNSVIGYYAAYKLYTGNSNIIFGDSAGFNLNGGTDNVLIGNKAGHNLTGTTSGGRWNIFVGNNAGLSSLSPVRNIFIGYDAGRENIMGQYNLYVGDQAGRLCTGYYNTILGGLAGSTNNFGNSNVAIGYVAGRDMKSANNVYLGMGAGYNNSGTVGGNVFIGTHAGENLSDQDNRLAIQSNRQSTVPLIYGEFDNKKVVINGVSPGAFTFYVNGSAGGNSDWNSTSDMRLKTNILDIANALDKVLKLKGVYFSWKDTKTYDGKQHIGFLAQDVEKVLPEVVNGANDSYTMQYAPITALLVEAIKEQQNTIDELQKKNTALEQKMTEMESLKSEVEKLKLMMQQLMETRN